MGSFNVIANLGSSFSPSFSSVSVVPTYPVSIDFYYQISDNGESIPTGEWSTTPHSEKGRYLWTKTVYNLGEGYTTVKYDVSYSGADGAMRTINHTSPDNGGNYDILSISDEEIDEIMV